MFGRGFLRSKSKNAISVTQIYKTLVRTAGNPIQIVSEPLILIHGASMKSARAKFSVAPITSHAVPTYASILELW